jgi:hypothetical protein
MILYLDQIISHGGDMSNRKNIHNISNEIDKAVKAAGLRWCIENGGKHKHIVIIGEVEGPDGKRVETKLKTPLSNSKVTEINHIAMKLKDVRKLITFFRPDMRIEINHCQYRIG